jgi:hypothetical protein
MKTMMVALGMLVLLGGQLASASVDRSTEVKTVKSATSTTAAVGTPVHVDRPYGHLGWVIPSDAGLAGDRLK